MSKKPSKCVKSVQSNKKKSCVSNKRKEQERLKTLEVERLQAERGGRSSKREAYYCCESKRRTKVAEASRANNRAYRILKEQADAKQQAEAEAKKQIIDLAKQKKRKGES